MTQRWTLGGNKVMLTEFQLLEIKVKEIGLFFLSNSGRLAEAVEELEMESELCELLENFEQILAGRETEEKNSKLG